MGHTTQVGLGGEPSSSARDVEQAATTRRYDRNARIYDLYDGPMDLLGGVRRRRRRLLAAASGSVLEVGIGTGRNLDLYPDGIDLTGIDLSSGMLARAQHRVGRLGLDDVVVLETADVGQLPYGDASFDTAVATCVFCSVADPVGGLRELARVVKPSGQVLLLEHVRPRSRLLGAVADVLNPLVRRVIGANIDRRTEDNVRAAGFEIVAVRAGGVWREIRAVPATPDDEQSTARERAPDEEEP